MDAASRKQEVRWGSFCGHAQEAEEDTQSNEMERRAARAPLQFKWVSCRQAARHVNQSGRPPRQPSILFELDEFQFVVNLRTSRTGAAALPSGMTSDHLRPLLDHVRDNYLLFLLGDQLAKAQTPASVNDAILLGRLTALQKPSGGVRGLVAGDIMRRLVARTMSHQLSKAVESATAPFQYTMTTEAGTQCIAHALQALTESNPQCT